MNDAQKSGYYKAIEVLENLAEDELGVNDADLYCKHTIEDFVQIMLDKMENL